MLSVILRLNKCLPHDKGCDNEGSESRERTSKESCTVCFVHRDRIGIYLPELTNV